MLISQQKNRNITPYISFFISYIDFFFPYMAWRDKTLYKVWYKVLYKVWYKGDRAPTDDINQVSW